MFETPNEHKEKVELVRNNLKKLSTNEKIFLNNKSSRLTYTGFKLLRDQENFFEIKIEADSFKVQDLVKISKLNSDLYFIDYKNVKIYTLDESFKNWCFLTHCIIDAIRYSC